MDKKILICIFNYRHDENARRWVEILSPFFETVVLDSGNDKVAGDFIQYPNIYYSGLFNEAKKLTEGKGYEWVGIICSDVTIEDRYTGNFITCLNWLLTTQNVGIWQAAPDADSRSVHGHYMGTNAPQHKVWIEGWMQFTKKDIWDELPMVDTTVNKYGWSIDTIAECMAYNKGLLTLMDDRCQVHHPADRGYPEDDARTQGRTWEADTLRQLGLSRYRNAQPLLNPIRYKYDFDISFVIPCMNRDECKPALEANLKKVFKDYTYEIIYVEQNDGGVFRLGQLRNIGALLARGKYIIIQDIDIIHLREVDLDEIVGTLGTPVRLYDSITQLTKRGRGYVQTLTEKRGGTGACLLITHEKWNALNGYSNLYRGWGSEDDTFRQFAGIKTYHQDMGHITHPRLMFKRRDITNQNKKVYNEFVLTNKIKHMDDGYRQMLFTFNGHETKNNVSLYKVASFGIIDAYKYKGLYNRYDQLGNVETKKVIYTCITGKYDSLVPQPYLEGWDFVCFTDDYQRDECWEIRPIPEHIKDLSNVKQQRYVKTHPHELLPEYDYSVWIDANMLMLDAPDDLIHDYPIEIPMHPVRNSISAEAQACIRKNKDSEEVIEAQMERYKEAGFPDNGGLVQSNIIFRRHNDPICIKLMEDWWNEIAKGSHRDQLSFNYACWLNENDERLKILILDRFIYKSRYFKWLIKHGEHGNGKGISNTPIVARVSNAAGSIFQVKQTQRTPVIKPTVPVLMHTERKDGIVKKTKIFL